MATTKKRLGAVLAVVTLMFVLVFSLAPRPADAYSNLCITHLGWMSGPAGNQRHSVGYLVAPNYTHKNVIIQNSGPGYWYTTSAYPKRCVF